MLCAQCYVVVLITLESIMECVEYMLLDNLGRHCDGSEFISSTIHYVLLASHELIQFERVLRHCLGQISLAIHFILGRDWGP